MPELRFPWETEPVAPAEEEPGPALPEVPVPPKPRGRRPDAMRQAASPTAPVWSYHHLTISGPAGEVAAFAEAARGSGIIPWRLDLDQLEEGVFVLAVSPPPVLRPLTVEGCRILARQFRNRVEARQARAAALVGRSRTCPFDLHALLPVPESVLQLGPTHPAALAWLAEHWGTTDGLRQVSVRDKPSTGRLPAGFGAVGHGFFTAAGEAPRAALVQLGARWPSLRFVLRPRPAG